MAGTRRAGPDFSRCYGHYREQSVQYALQHCLACPKMKACVRLTWGMDQPPHARRRGWDRNSRDKRPRRPPWPSAAETLAT